MVNVGGSSRVAIRLLGGFAVELDGRPVPDESWRRNRARGVVKLLALAPAHRLHREQLMDALWPDLEPRAAAANLRKALHFARAAIGPGVIATRGEMVALEAGAIEVDAEAFEGAADAGRCAEAVDRYTGDLLPEDRFESWADEPRERLLARYRRCLREVAADLEARGGVEAAIAAHERLVGSDRIDEGAHIGLMRLHAAAGSRPRALRQYRQLESALRAELDVEPSPAARQLRDEIAAGGLGAPATGLAPADQHFRAPERRPTDQEQTAPELDAVDGEADEAIEERKLVTVLSVDAPAVAADAARDPEATAARLAAWTDGARATLEGCGAHVESAGAGSIIAVFGAPDAGEDDAEQAVAAAIDMQERDETGLRVGIATGEAIVRTRPDGRAPVVSGEVVRSAGWLREASRGRALVSTRTIAAVRGRFRFETPVEITIGGRSLAAAALLGPVAEPPRTGLAEPPLVGRDLELAALLALLDDVRSSRRPRLVHVSGAAGVGKSRLVHEVATVLGAAAEPVRILRGRSLSGGRGATYWALGEVLREACGISLGDPADIAQHCLRETCEQILVSLGPDDVATTGFALATSAGLDLDVNPLAAQPPEEVARHLTVAWPRFATALAEAVPTVVILEDLHWASTELVDMSELLVARSTGPLLVLATARPELRERHPSWGVAVDASVVALSPLSDDHSGQLLDLLLVGTEAGDSAGVRARVLERAEGNPLYLEQLVMHLREGSPEGLPDSLQTLLQARMDGLPAVERRILQEAAVIGRSFWLSPLQAAQPDEHLAARLGRLESRRFIIRRPTSSLPGQEEYTFRHALLHDAAYASVPRTRRLRSHGRVGRWLEGVAEGWQDEVADLLAHHFESAVPTTGAAAESAEVGELRAKAVEYLARAGDGARRRFAVERALELHGRARTLARTPPERLRVLEATAEDHESVFHGDEAGAAYEAALQLARSDDACRPALPRLARKLAWLMSWNPGAFRATPDPADAEALVDEGLAAEPDEIERAWLLLVRGATARLYRGSEPFGQGTRADPRLLAARVADVDAALEVAERHGLADLLVAAGHARGLLYGLEGRFAEMLDLARRDVERLPPDSPAMEQSDAIRKLAVGLITVVGDFEAALELGWRSHDLAGDTNPHQQQHTLWPILAALFHLGRLEEMPPLIDQAVAAFRIEPAIECQFVRDGPVIGASALVLLGRQDEAAELAALPGDPLADRESASAWQARYATLSGDPRRARAIAHDKALERRTYGPQHAYALLEALEAEADWPAAAAFLADARRAVDGNATLLPLADRVEAQVRASAGDVRTARALARRAVEAFRRHRMPLEEARTLEVLAALVNARLAYRHGEAAASLRRAAGIPPGLPATTMAGQNPFG